MRFLLLLLLVLPMYSHAAIWTIHANLKGVLPVDAIGTLDGTFTTDNSGKPTAWNLTVATVETLFGDFPGVGFVFTNTPCVPTEFEPNPICTAKSISGGFSFFHSNGQLYGPGEYNLEIIGSNGVLKSVFYSCCRSIDVTALTLSENTLTSTPSPVPEPTTALVAGVGLLLIIGKRLGQRRV